MKWSKCQWLQETEGDADIAEAVRLAVVLLEIVAGKLAAPHKVVIAAERKLHLEAVGSGLDLHDTAGLPGGLLAAVILDHQKDTFLQLRSPLGDKHGVEPERLSHLLASHVYHQVRVPLPSGR